MATNGRLGQRSDTNNVANLGSAPARFRVSGWDPALLLSQIFALQALHYLTLSLIAPPLLSILADPVALSLEGGASNVAMIMDWREMTGRPTIEEIHLLTKLMKDDHKWMRSWPSGRRLMFGGAAYAADSRRSWVLGGAWTLTSLIDVFYLYHLIRRPTHVLDFSLTLLFNHLVLTTYYASAFPTSTFFWLVVGLSGLIQIVWAEQLCIKRELRDGLGVGWKADERDEDANIRSSNRNRDDVELGPVQTKGSYERLPTEERTS